MSKKNASNEKDEKTGTLRSIMEGIVGTIDASDEAEAAKHVATLRAQYPQATPEELVERLIKQQCLKTGAIGAVTSGTAIIPGLGTIVALTFGVAADVSMTFRLQTQLVLEIINVYQHELSLVDKRNIAMLISGISIGGNRLISKAGVQIAEKATIDLEEKFITKALPVIGVAASAGINIVSTYLIGRRAQAYFQRGPDALGDWGENARVLTGLDERKIRTWLAEGTENAWRLTNSRMQDMAGSMVVVAKSTGELAVIGAGKAGGALTRTSKKFRPGIGSALGAIVHLTKKVSSGLASGVRKAGSIFGKFTRNERAKPGK
ncbi:MAG: hypothetical protein NT075_21035 [Chloroflexi bacterium]|nr:hypothetical protein [Chloroflexota bacterium]